MGCLPACSRTPCPETRTPRRCAAFVHCLGDVPARLLQGPVDVELAVLGERAGDAGLPGFVRALGDLVTVGQRPRAQAVAGLLEFGHVTGIGGGRHLGRLVLHELHRTLQADVADRATTLLAHDLRNIEVVGFAPEVGGDDADRADGLEAIGVHHPLDPFAVGVDRRLDLRVAALDIAGVDEQHVLDRAIQHLEAGQLAAGDSIVFVRHAGQHADEAAQAHLHVVTDVARHVQAGVTTQQVPAVVDVVGLGDLDVAVVATGRLEGEAGALVGAALDVVDLVADLLARDALGDFPRTLAKALFIGKPVVTRSLNRLSDADLVKRARDPADGRSILVTRTERGDAMMRRLGRAMASAANGI
ncbi:MAG: MarR family transcriptional regulator [Chitinophagaceae bacterium]|nr:MAG: MarR family transcriptional regulator [Chitinophagaceae bacterium]